MIDTNTVRETATKAAQDATDSTIGLATKAKDIGTAVARNVVDNAGTYYDRAKEFGVTATDATTETARTTYERLQTLTGKGIDRVSDMQVGEKNVGERAQATVDTVQERIDVDQIQDQVAKVREQMEHVLISWKDTFRPAEPEQVKVVTPTKKTATKKATTTKATATKK